MSSNDRRSVPTRPVPDNSPLPPVSGFYGSPSAPIRPGRPGEWERAAGWKPPRPARPSLAGRLPRGVLLTLVALSLILGFAGATAITRLADLGLATTDAGLQLAYLKSEVSGGTILQTDRLVSTKAHLQQLDSDLARIQAELPGTSSPDMRSVVHLLRMGRDFTQAGIEGIDVPIALLPALKGMLSGLGGSSGASASSAAAPPLTTAQIDALAAKTDRAAALVDLGLQERAQVHNADLQRLHLGALVPTLQKLDAQTPKLRAYLADASGAVRALPDLLGLSAPAHYLLFGMDSDELRPTGGFYGNYAVVTLANARLQGGVHLRDIYELDCPTGLDSCSNNGIPNKFAWFDFQHVHLTDSINLRDSNLDPDVPTSAQSSEQYAVQEGLPQANGVFAFTPALMERILTLTGPIRVDAFNRTVTADNLRDTIHYFHILNAFCASDNHPNDPRCAELKGANTSNLNTSDRKAFDAALGATLFHTIGALPASDQGKLFRTVLEALQTKDLVLYFNDQRLETLLTTLTFDGAVQTPPGDSLFLVDTNVGASYVNGDVRERAQDVITLGADGSATHDLTLTYDYPVVPHSWNDIYLPSGGNWRYHDFVRALVPTGTSTDAINGCDPFPAAQEQSAVLSCYFFLTRADTPRYCDADSCQSATLTLHMRWTVPGAVSSTSGGATQYPLFIQKQPGTNNAWDITIVPPDGASLVLPDGSPLTLDGNGHAHYSGTLTRDLPLLVTLHS